jgi:hypothetical protein
VEIMERWIPDFKAAALGVQVGVNWLQVNHTLVANRETVEGRQRREEPGVQHTNREDASHEH